MSRSSVVPWWRRHPRWSLAIGAAGVLVLAGVAMLPVLSGRTDPPRYSHEAARKAIDAARDADAGRWAAQALLEAESAFRAATIENRRQETRFLLLRNFAVARAGFRIAEVKGSTATSLAVRSHKDARAAAEEAITAADESVSMADSYASSMHLEHSKRSLLQRSKIGVAEARNLQAAGEPIAARDRAELVVRQAGEVQKSAVSLAARYTDPERVNLWRRWAEETVAESARSGGRAIVISKERHVLTLFGDGRPIRTYRAEMGYNMVAGKLRSGDGVTPEGRYRITAKKGAGQSTYYKALLLNYPNDEDRVRFDRARRSGSIPRGASPGGLIEIHGEGGRGKDWTKGCIALSNTDMDDLFARVGSGTSVTIVGSDGRGGVFTDMVRLSQSQLPSSGVTGAR